VPVPEVVVQASRPKRVAPAPARAPAPAPRLLLRAPQPAPSAIPTAVPASPLAAFGTQGVPGALPKPPGQTITTVSGERIRNEPALTS
jgi:hypothetical protein